MIEFYLQREEGVTRAKEFMLMLASRDVDSAVRMARWGRVNLPDLVDGLQDELSREVGKKVLSV